MRSRPFEGVERVHRGGGAATSKSGELGDEGVNGGGFVVAGDGDAVVSVIDEVFFAEFVKLDRGEVLSFGEGDIHALPPFSRA